MIYMYNVIKLISIFDEKYKNNESPNELQFVNNSIKHNLQNLILCNTNKKDDFIKIFKKKYYENDNIIKKKLHDEKISNVLLFFYKSNEHLQIIKNLKNKIKIVMVNCSKSINKKYEEFFKIYEYPTIKYVTKDHIYNYFGEIDEDDIIKFVNKKKQ